MSQWTHITGAIRVDGVVLHGNSSKMLEGLKGILGRTSTWESSHEECIATTVPCGSEGSLQYHIHEYGTGLPWAVVTVWGDLRDYSDVKAVTDWFDRVCTILPLIRQAILEIEVDGIETVVLRWDGNKLNITKW